MPPRKSPARAAKKSAAGASGYDFDSGEHEQEVVVLAGKLKAVKGKDNIVKCLKVGGAVTESDSIQLRDVSWAGGGKYTLKGRGLRACRFRAGVRADAVATLGCAPPTPTAASNCGQC